MLRRIRLRNFMSHVDTELELADGVNVIVGPNNCGKSAIVSALSVLAANASGDYMVRHGCDDCSVTVTTAEGDEITWRRVKGTPSYILNGQEFYRVGRGEPPEEIRRALRLRSGDPDLDGFDVHFGHQKQPIFLLNEPGSKPAQFFASSSDAGRLLEMQKLHKDNVIASRRQRASLLEEQEAVKTKTAVLDQAAALAEEVAQLEFTYRELKELDNRIGVLEQEIQRLQRLQRQHDINAKVAQALDRLTEPPVLADTSELEKDAAHLRAVQLQIKKTSEDAQALATLRVPPLMEDTALLESHIRRLFSLATRVEYSRSLMHTAQTVQEPPAMHDLAFLAHRLPRLIELHRLVTRETAVVEASDKLVPVPAFNDTSELSEDIRRLRTILTSVTALERQVQTLADLQPFPELEPEEQLAEAICELRSKTANYNYLAKKHLKIQGEKVQVEAAIEAYLKENPVCPTCGSEMKLEVLLRGRCQHGA
ncbi:MAG: AAA family ATPase [Firmicutes bacterium]|nr:AAA family ATPase [Bacillota bacterium]